MNIAYVFGIIASCIAIGAVIFASGQFTESVRANTKATEKLSQVIDGHLTWSAEIVREHDERFHEHDTRISALETRRR